MVSTSKKLARKARNIIVAKQAARTEDAMYRRYKDRILDGDVIGMKVDSSFRYVRVDPSLNLPEHRDRSRATVERLIRDLRLVHWVIPAACTKPTRIGVMESDRQLLLSGLKSAAHLAHWSLDPLGPNGRRNGSPQLLPSINQRRDFGGVRLYEYVSPNLNSSFKADEQQGVEIHFWRSDGTTVESRIWNEYFTLLPDPVFDRGSFESVLDVATQPHADEVNFPIDVVYTWVDGSDPSWQKEKADTLRIGDTADYVKDAVKEARFADHDELRYSLRSIEQYAPWVNHIWIVTNGQAPPWLEMEHPRVSVVNHEEIWPDEQGLPNFNSHAIEACLHRISGLAEHFLYFNDDFLLARPVKPEIFFHGNGISKLFYSKALVDFLEVKNEDNASSVAAKNARSWLHEVNGGESNFSRKFFHVPTPIVRGVLQRAETEFPEAFSATRSAQFRQPTDIAVAGSFYFNLAQVHGQAVPGRIRYDYIDPAEQEGRRKFERVIRMHHLDCIVINDGSSDETARQRIETDRVIRVGLQDFLPIRSSFELDPNSQVARSDIELIDFGGNESTR